MGDIISDLEAARGASNGGSAIWQDEDAINAGIAEIAKLRTALRAIIERADNGALGSSKVQDMKRIATDALAD